MGRATQGVKLINLGEDDAIAAVTKVPASKDEETEEGVVTEEGSVETPNQENISIEETNNNE